MYHNTIYSFFLLLKRITKPLMSITAESYSLYLFLSLDVIFGFSTLILLSFSFTLFDHHYLTRPLGRFMFGDHLVFSLSINNTYLTASPNMLLYIADDMTGRFLV